MLRNSHIFQRHSRVGGLVQFSLIAALVQAVWWLVVDPYVFGLPKFSNATRFEEFEVATLSAPTADALRQAKFTKVEAPWSDCCSRGYRAVRYQLVLDKVPPDGLFSANPGQADNYWVYVNGELVKGLGRLDRNDPTYEGNVRAEVFLPPSMLHPGANTIDAIFVRAKMPWFDAGGFIVGPKGAFSEALLQRVFQANVLPLFNMGAAFALAILALVVALRAESREIALWSALLLGGWVLLSGFYRWLDPPFTPTGRLTYYFALALIQPVAWFGLLTAWSGRFKPAHRLAAAALGLMLFIWAAWALAWGDDGAFDRISEVTNWFGFALMGMGVLALLWSLVRDGTYRREWEAAVLLLTATLMSVGIYFELVEDVSWAPLENGLVLFLLAFSVAFAVRNVRLFQSQGQINALLKTQLDQRTAELEEAHDREKAMVMVQAHQAERQRIMRDMHDGLGSNLMSMLLMARRGKVEAPVVAEGLQTVIDEMRLMIDSMDSVGESLQSALSIFRERMQLRVEGAGKHFVWRHAEVDLPTYGPRTVLQIFRIMQEAVSNALKHSSGDTVTISVEPAAEAAHVLRIVVADNGSGLGAANARGRGMANMAGRAGSIGAELGVEDGPGGVRVVLDLPPARDDEDA